MAQVLINGCYGGFALSEAALDRLEELGVDVDMDELERHDPRLLQVYKELGDKTGRSYSKLHAVEVKGNLYRIEQYDGMEWVVTPPQLVWTEIKS